MTGELDLHTAPELRDRLVRLVQDGHTHIFLDLSELSFMDSTGLGVLVGHLKRVREHEGTLVLVAPQPPVRKVLSVTGLDQVLPSYPTLEAARAEHM